MHPDHFAGLTSRHMRQIKNEGRGFIKDDAFCQRRERSKEALPHPVVSIYEMNVSREKVISIFVKIKARKASLEAQGFRRTPAISHPTFATSVPRSACPVGLCPCRVLCPT